MSSVEDTTLSEFKSVLELYITKIRSNLPLEEYLSIDYNEYPTDLEILENVKILNENEDASFDDTPEMVPIAHQPSNKEMRIMLQKC